MQRQCAVSFQLSKDMSGASRVRLRLAWSACDGQVTRPKFSEGLPWHRQQTRVGEPAAASSKCRFEMSFCHC